MKLFTIPEIAERFGVSTVTIRKRIRKAGVVTEHRAQSGLRGRPAHLFTATQVKELA